MQAVIIERGDKLRNDVDGEDMKKIRRAMCQLNVYLKSGSLVKARIVRAPECVMRKIRARWHDLVISLADRILALFCCLGDGTFITNCGSSISFGSIMLVFFRCLVLALGIPLVVRMTASSASITSVFSVITCL
ncbi:hypothetical protein GN958_ATG09262 [Phytophthora infestans]|uniref:Uncharacterized protein n=1 Tax=Phytophthora infestans TaxID=4787 RepID=A0A8S9UPV1_PHYIN|nr:hypothetical protein GN958_ATG09262 [Phytophthora infestans]